MLFCNDVTFLYGLKYCVVSNKAILQRYNVNTEQKKWTKKEKNKTKQNKTKQNKNKTKQNKTKQNKTKKDKPKLN